MSPAQGLDRPGEGEEQTGFGCETLARGLSGPSSKCRPAPLIQGEGAGSSSLASPLLDALGK